MADGIHDFTVADRQKESIGRTDHFVDCVASSDISVV